MHSGQLVYMTACFFFLTKIDIPEKVKVVVIGLNMVALYGQNVVITSPEELTLKEIWDAIIENHKYILLGVASGYLVSTTISIHKKQETKKYVLGGFERQRVLKETQLILDSVGEAVITYTEHGINFFNRSGLQILCQCAEKLPDEESQEACLKELIMLD